MTRLAIRLALGGGREQLARLAVTAVGVALGTLLMLLAAVAYPAIHAHEVRGAWMHTGVHNVQPAQDEAGTDPLLWRLRIDSYAGQDYIRVDLAATGPRAPLPAGLSRLPGPGEVAASPAMARLIRSVPPDQLADRFPGRIVETVGYAALQYSGSLVVFVGYPPAQLRGQDGVDEVRSTEAHAAAIGLTDFGRIVVGMGSAALLVPLLVLVGTATRLSAARREQRMAAMRLVGATPHQIRVVAFVEAMVGAVAGTLIGFAGFVVARPYAARYNIDGSPYFPADLRLSWAAGVLIGLGVPALAGAAALLSLRKVQVTPLGVVRQAPRGRPTWRRLVPLGASLALFFAALPAIASKEGGRTTYLIALGVFLLVGSIVVAGPWFTVSVGRLVSALSRRTPGLLAGRRLTDNPVAGFRSISGLVLAVFLVTITSVATAIGTRSSGESHQAPIPAHAVVANFTGHESFLVPTAQADVVAARLRALPGVTGVLALRWASNAALPRYSPLPGVASCAEVRATHLASCADPAAPVGLDGDALANGEVRQLPAPATAAPLDRLRVLGVLVTTDGRTSTVERVRTAVQVQLPPVWLTTTTEELKGFTHKQNDQYQRIGDTVLLASLLIAGFSLAVSVAGGLVERKRPFALLRLAGMRPAELRRVLLAETAGPLVTVALVSAGLGLAVVSYVAWVTNQVWAPPQPSYWWVLGGGLALSLGIAVAATLPLLNRLTSLETARFE